MKKLTNREIAALARKIQDDLNTGPPAIVINHFKAQVKKWMKTSDAKVFKKYDICPEINQIFLKPFKHEGIRYMMGTNARSPAGYPHAIYLDNFGFKDVLSGYRRLYSSKAGVSTIALENAIVLAQIESTSLDALITHIKELFS